MGRLFLMAAATAVLLASAGAASAQIYSYCKYPKVCPTPPEMPNPPIQTPALRASAPLLAPARALKVVKQSDARGVAARLRPLGNRSRA